MSFAINTTHLLQLHWACQMPGHQWNCQLSRRILCLAMHDRIEPSSGFPGPCQKLKASADISIFCRLAFLLLTCADCRSEACEQRTAPSIVLRRTASKVACHSEEAARL